MKQWLRRIGVASGVLAGLVAIAAAVVYARSEWILARRYPVPQAAMPIPGDAASIAEGRRLATVYGCMDGCHGGQGEGVVFFDQPPIARLVAPNLSAAARRYGDAELVALIRDGVRPDGRSVFVMPAQAFRYLTDGDVGRIVAFLRTLPLLEGPGPSLSLGPVGRIGVATGRFRTAAQLIGESVPPPEARTDAARHGRYLAVTICAECHGTSLHGDANPDFVAPDLSVVAAYSADDFTRLLRTGTALGGRELGVMRVRSQRNLSHLTDAEIAALYEYLRGFAAG